MSTRHVSSGGIVFRPAGHSYEVALIRVMRAGGETAWALPKGWVEQGEELEMTAVREAREETGLDIRLERLLNVYSYKGSVPVIIVYTATMIGGCLGCDDEGLEARFFAPETIPWTELAFRSTREALAEFLGGREGAPLHPPAMQQ